MSAQDLAQDPAPETTSASCGPPEAEASSVLTIDLAAIEANWKKLRGLAVPTECAAVVKADAYGCGLEPVATLLYHAGCTTFFVADLAEGKRARRIAPQACIYILGGLPPGTAEVFAEYGLRPVIGSAAELAEWDGFAAATGWRGGIALHVDTGMNRLGLSVEEAIALAPRAKTENHGIMLLMSHFVAAQIHEHPRNSVQMQIFRDIRGLYRGIPASISNSSGIFLGSSAHLDLVRPGAALYGVNPTPEKPNPMRPVVRLQARVILTRDVAHGDTVGYDASWTARRPTRIAVLAVGYADGYFRIASGTDQKPGGHVMIAGHACPIVGRVSMDLMAVDITDLQGDDLQAGTVRRGDYATLIGKGLDVDSLAEQFQTNGYEVLTSLGRRYARVYRNDEKTDGAA